MEARKETTDVPMTDVASPRDAVDETPPQRRKLILMTSGMLWQKNHTSKRLQRLLSGAYTITIQKLPDANPDLPRTTCAYRFCPSLHHECLPGTYRVNLEPGRVSENKHKSIPVQPFAQFDYVAKSSERHKATLQGKSAQNNVFWYCLRCFEKIWRCTDEDTATVKAMELPEYVPMARLESKIYLEGRSGRTHPSPNLDIGKAHEAVYKRWVARQVSLEVGAELAEDLDAFLTDPCVKIYSTLVNLSAVAGGYDEPSIEVNGKNLSVIFTELDELLEARNHERRQAAKQESLRNIHAATELGKKAWSLEEEFDIMDDIMPVPRGGYDATY